MQEGYIMVSIWSFYSVFKPRHNTEPSLLHTTKCSFWKDFITEWHQNIIALWHSTARFQHIHFYNLSDLQSTYWLTIMGYGSMLKQLGDKYAFLFFASIFTKLRGSASTSSPLQLRWRSKYKVFERVSPSKAPHSTKNPSRCKYTQSKRQSHHFKLL
jgi:hypothetical protein